MDVIAQLHSYRFKTHLIVTTVPLPITVVKHLPNDLTPYLAKHYEWFDVPFINLNLPLSTQTLTQAVFDHKLLGYSSNMVEYGDEMHMYCGVLSIDYASGKKYKLNPMVHATRISKPRRDIAVEYSYPLRLLLRPVVTQCPKCHAMSCLLGGCKNGSCDDYRMVDLTGETVQLSNEFTEDDGLQLDPQRKCTVCRNCKLCRKGGKLCKRHVICKHSKIKTVPNMRRRITTDGLW